MFFFSLSRLKMVLLPENLGLLQSGLRVQVKSDVCCARYALNIISYLDLRMSRFSLMNRSMRTRHCTAVFPHDRRPPPFTARGIFGMMIRSLLLRRPKAVFFGAQAEKPRFFFSAPPRYRVWRPNNFVDPPKKYFVPQNVFSAVRNESRSPTYGLRPSAFNPS